MSELERRMIFRDSEYNPQVPPGVQKAAPTISLIYRFKSYGRLERRLPCHERLPLLVVVEYSICIAFSRVDVSTDFCFHDF